MIAVKGMSTDIINVSPEKSYSACGQNSALIGKVIEARQVSPNNGYYVTLAYDGHGYATPK